MDVHRADAVSDTELVVLKYSFVYSLWAGVQPILDPRTETDRIAVQCTCPGRGKELVGVCVCVCVIGVSDV